MKKPIFGSGWKMYFTDSEAVEHALGIKEKIKEENEIELFVLPSFTILSKIKEIFEGTSINVGAQNMCWEEKGAYTGEVSVRSLNEIGIQYVEIGHSERRELFGETDHTVNMKLKKALEFNFIPVFCIGEESNQKEKRLTEEILAIEIKTALSNIKYEDAVKIIYAYEPVWAIGKDDAAQPEYVEKVHSFIRETLKSNYSQSKDGTEFKIVYGGSVSLKNVEKLIKQPDIDGVFVGRSSLKLDSYIEMLQIIKENF